MDSTKNDQYSVWMGHYTVMEHVVETNRGGGRVRGLYIVII